MHYLNDLVTAGKVHYLGISDTNYRIVSNCNQYARDHGLRQFVVVRVPPSCHQCPHPPYSILCTQI